MGLISGKFSLLAREECTLLQQSQTLCPSRHRLPYAGHGGLDGTEIPTGYKTEQNVLECTVAWEPRDTPMSLPVPLGEQLTSLACPSGVPPRLKESPPSEQITPPGVSGLRLTRPKKNSQEEWACCLKIVKCSQISLALNKEGLLSHWEGGF